MAPRIQLEIACDGITDAVSATEGGADRIELCSALELGGLTPSLGALREVLATVDVPVVAMVRPRAGNFVYETAELSVMARDAELLVRHGADGVVLGCLTPKGDVDEAACRLVLDAAAEAGPPFESVFHRAIDEVRGPLDALEVLIDLGFTRVLTSGGAPTALEGVARIREMVERAAGRIEILPGGGIRDFNVEAVVKQTGCGAVHLSRR